MCLLSDGGEESEFFLVAQAAPVDAMLSIAQLVVSSGRFWLKELLAANPEGTGPAVVRFGDPLRSRDRYWRRARRHSAKNTWEKRGKDVEGTLTMSKWFG